MNIFFIILITFFATFTLNAVETQQQKLEKYCKKYPQEWQGHYNLGRQYYQQEDFTSAENSFAAALKNCQEPQSQESIFYNLGNTYFQQADDLEKKEEKIPLLEKSIQNYESALALNPEAKDTKHNLELAKKELEELKQEQQKNKDNQDQNKDSQNNDKENDKKDQNQQKGPNNQQQNSPQNSNSEQQQDPQSQENQQQSSPQANEQKNEKEMQAILQKAKNDEHILPINFSQDSDNFQEEKVLKNW